MKILQNVPLASYTTFGIGGPADYFCKAESTSDIVQSVAWAENKGLDFFTLGSGANILIGDKGFRGLVIKNEARSFVVMDKPKASTALTRSNQVLLQNDNAIFLNASSGITIAELIEITAKKGLSGLEHFVGIPSTLGGALWQNLHFLSSDREKTVFIGDMLQEAKLLEIKNQKSKIKNVNRDYFHFGYDYSSLHDTKDIVLSACLKLTKKDPEVIKKHIEENLEWRAEKHPEKAIKTSAGSVFKKIKDHGAGRLIDKLGLKGYKIGGAIISAKHANFIINTGNATAKDVRSLIEFTQKMVKEKLGLNLDTEISFVGEF